jgi:hypothetical protein
MGANKMYPQKYVERILDCYAVHLDLDLTVATTLTGTASEIKTVYTPEVDGDSLIFRCHADFSNTGTGGVTVNISSTIPAYEFNLGTMPPGATSPQPCPITANFGITTQNNPLIWLTAPFFLKRQGKLQFVIQNSSTSATTGGNLVIRGVKLLRPINGGYDPGY